jgi:hypothetical protein
MIGKAVLPTNTNLQQPAIVIPFAIHDTFHHQWVVLASQQPNILFLYRGFLTAILAIPACFWQAKDDWFHATFPFKVRFVVKFGYHPYRHEFA